MFPDGNGMANRENNGTLVIAGRKTGRGGCGWCGGCSLVVGLAVDG